MMWKLSNSQDDWALFFKAKYTNKHGQWNTNWKLSSVWNGLKWAWQSLQDDLKWNVGDGKSISVRFDNWIGDSPLINIMVQSQFVENNINMKVAEILNNGNWSIPEEIKNAITSFSLPDVSGMDDELCWKVTLSCEFTISAVVNKIILREEKVQWSKYIWNAFLHLSIASNVWKLLQGIYIDDTKMVKNGYAMVSRCCICEEAEDNMSHLLWDCKFSLAIWAWLCNIFNFSMPKNFEDVWRCAETKISLIQHVWIRAACFTLKEFWFQKNERFFEEIKPDISKFKCKLLKTIFEHSIRLKGSKWNQVYDNQIISFFKLGPRFSRYQCITACQRYAPELEFTMFCCDGVSFGNPGAAGFGIVIRDHFNQVFGAITGGLGTSTNYISEVYAVVNAAELAVTWNLQKIIITSDSNTIANQFENNHIPWFVRTRWRNAIKNISVIRFTHSLREINFSVDCAAKRGASL
ncbi:uncharacterized protein LOC113290798 [Papaver somniferum]|uniref:uncharacterized protein LOC113290798 n=1 Tax=Papaver somniferum TaxID=3469 RepID=UPI000E705E58|nr:uncharacterized protein LOC113290798 [Papaver somniferum]